MAGCRPARNPDSGIHRASSTVRALEHQCVVGALAFCAFPIERSDDVAVHRCPYRALSLSALGAGGTRPDVHFRTTNLALLGRGTESRRDCAQGLPDEFVGLLLDQALVGAARQRQCRHREPRDLPNVGATAWDTLTGHHSANRFNTRET
jgi:hypothetical protein